VFAEVTVQGTPLKIATGNDALAAIDTGTTLIGGPTTDVENLWAQIKGSAKIPNMPGFFQFRASFLSSSLLFRPAYP
jgi:cathepsin D